MHLVSDGLQFDSAAKNFYHLVEMVDVTTYDYVCFTDQDDMWSRLSVLLTIRL